MICLFALLLILVVISIRYKKDFNNSYLDKNNTTIINGIFIIIIFFNHFHQYITNLNIFDTILYDYFKYLGQLVVTTFLFFSGYGIFESIKNKKDYLKTFFKKRFIPTFINWLIALLLFLVVSVFMKSELSFSKIILSIIGWDSLGNSNWYMFDIFVLYIFVIISSYLSKDHKTFIFLMLICTCGFIIALYSFKEKYWYNTLLCFPFGMYYSYYKDLIDKIVMKRIRYWLFLGLSIIMFVTFYIIFYNKGGKLLYTIVPCLFVLLISIILMKINLKSKILYWFGNNLFWIYILQRLPMIVLKDKINNNYIYFISCFIITIIMTLIINYLRNIRKKEN